MRTHPGIPEQERFIGTLRNSSRVGAVMKASVGLYKTLSDQTLTETEGDEMAATVRADRCSAPIVKLSRLSSVRMMSDPQKEIFMGKCWSPDGYWPVSVFVCVKQQMSTILSTHTPTHLHVL